MIAELRHETQSQCVSLSEAETVSDSDSEALNPRNRLPESCGTGLYVLQYSMCVLHQIYTLRIVP